MDRLVEREIVSIGRTAFIYYIELGGNRVAQARVFLVDRQNAWALTGVRVAQGYRRQGLARCLLQGIAADADRYGWVLRLVPEPDRTTDITKDRLAAFYERFGFQGSDGMMRFPLAKEMV